MKTNKKYTQGGGGGEYYEKKLEPISEKISVGDKIKKFEPIFEKS